MAMTVAGLWTDPTLRAALLSTPSSKKHSTSSFSSHSVMRLALSPNAPPDCAMLWMNCSALDSSLWIAGTALARYSMDGVKSDVVGMADTSHMNV